MSGFQLDTSGFVRAHEHWCEGDEVIRWSYLSLFCQGYTAAILEAANAPFHKLAPATIARIIADCEGLQKLTPPNWGESFAAGKLAWKYRAGGWVGFRDEFPPLTVTIGDDGLVYFKEAA